MKRYQPIEGGPVTRSRASQQILLQRRVLLALTAGLVERREYTFPAARTRRALQVRRSCPSAALVTCSLSASVCSLLSVVRVCGRPRHT
jgi:hypothetical protein